MAVAVGTRLGPYEIEAALGAGGVGEVYRVRDTPLERTAAIKGLPSHLSDSSDLECALCPRRQPSVVEVNSASARRIGRRTLSCQTLLINRQVAHRPIVAGLSAIRKFRDESLKSSAGTFALSPSVQNGVQRDLVPGAGLLR